MECIVVYVTMPSVEVAQNISRTVVGERLAACANMLGSIWSCFHWEGSLSESNEVACLLKTTKTAYPALEKRILELHPYDVPCIIALPLENGYGPFCQWIATESAEPFSPSDSII